MQRYPRVIWEVISDSMWTDMMLVSQSSFVCLSLFIYFERESAHVHPREHRGRGGERGREESQASSELSS